jgi:hypothetical protein
MSFLGYAAGLADIPHVEAICRGYARVCFKTYTNNQRGAIFPSLQCANRVLKFCSTQTMLRSQFSAASPNACGTVL